MGKKGEGRRKREVRKTTNYNSQVPITH